MTRHKNVLTHCIPRKVEKNLIAKMNQLSSDNSALTKSWISCKSETLTELEYAMVRSESGCKFSVCANCSIFARVGLCMPRSSVLRYVRLDTSPKSSCERPRDARAALSAAGNLLWITLVEGMPRLRGNEHHKTTIYSVHFRQFFGCSAEAARTAWLPRNGPTSWRSLATSAHLYEKLPPTRETSLADLRAARERLPGKARTSYASHVS